MPTYIDVYLPEPLPGRSPYVDFYKPAFNANDTAYRIRAGYARDKTGLRKGNPNIFTLVGGSMQCVNDANAGNRNVSLGKFTDLQVLSWYHWALNGPVTAAGEVGDLWISPIGVLTDVTWEIQGTTVGHLQVPPDSLEIQGDDYLLPYLNGKKAGDTLAINLRFKFQRITQ